MQLVNTQERRTSTITVAGAPVSVVAAPRPTKANPLQLVLRAAKSIFTGMRTTLGYLLRPSTTVTRQYPENRDTLKIHDRYRAKLEFLGDDGFHRCTACRICERECPNTSIIIDASKGTVTKKWEVDRYVWRLDTCTFCNICVQVCPFDAIDFSGKFESSVFDRRLLLFNLNEYAGPHASLAEKMVPDAQEREKLKRDCDFYTGDLPVNGDQWAGIPALPGADQVPTPMVPAPDTIETPVMPEPEAKPKPKPKPQAAPEAQSDAASQAAGAAEAKPAPKPAAQPDAEPSATPDSTPDGEPKPKTDPEENA